MPNQGNKSKGKSGIVQSKKNSTMPFKQKHAQPVLPNTVGATTAKAQQEALVKGEAKQYPAAPQTIDEKA